MTVKFFKLLHFQAILPLISILCLVMGMIDGFAWNVVAAEKKQSVSFSGKYLAADYANSQRDPKLAAEFYGQAQEEMPDNIILLQKSYLAALNAGEVEKAVIYAQQAADLDKKDLFAQVLLALQSIKKGDFKDSTQRFDKLINNTEEASILGVSQVILPYLQVWSLMGEKEYQKAETAIEKILGDNQAGAPFLYFQMALVYDLAGEKDKAVKYYERTLASDHVPYAHIKAAGNFYERQKMPSKARDLYLRYQKNYPHMEYFSRDIERLDTQKLATSRWIAHAEQGVAEVMAEAGRVLYTAELYRDALTYLQLALYFEPGHHDSTILLATYYESSGQYDRAELLYKHVKEDSDLYWPSRIYRAENLYRQGQKEEAIELLEAIEHHPSMAYAALLTLADLLRSDNRFYDAVYIYSKLLNLIEPGLQKEHWSILFARGASYERLGKWKEAESDFSAALELYPNQPEVLNYLGYSWIDRGINIEEAKKMVELAVKLRPDDGQIMDSVGWALFKLKEYQKAVAYIEKAVELLPQDNIINDHLGDVYWQVGRKNEAFYQWEKALKYTDTVREQKKIRQKITHGLLE